MSIFLEQGRHQMEEQSVTANLLWDSHIPQTGQEQLLGERGLPGGCYRSNKAPLLALLEKSYHISETR